MLGFPIGGAKWTFTGGNSRRLAAAAEALCVERAEVSFVAPRPGRADAWVALPGGCGSKPFGYHFGVGAPPILVHFKLGLGCLPGVRALTHGLVSRFGFAGVGILRVLCGFTKISNWRARASEFKKTKKQKSIFHLFSWGVFATARRPEPPAGGASLR